MQREARRILLALVVSAALCFAALTAALFLSHGKGAEAAPVATPRKAEARSSAERKGEARSGAETTRNSPAPAPRPTLTVRESPYGPILFDRRGFALYAFTRDPRDRSVCEGDCAAAWPPYILRGELATGPGTARSLLGTTRRSGGATQVTYAGRPLYYYVGDREPGQVLCQDIVEFGGTWLVVRASGRLVR